MKTVLTGAALHDGQRCLTGRALLLEGQTPHAIPLSEVPGDARQITLNGGWVLPGFVDLQVNGGGGILLNDARGAEGLRRIAAAHHRLGTRALLPTLITDTPAQTAAAIDAVANLIDAGPTPILGLHLEGPHLDPRRKGAHDGKLIRPMATEDLELLIAAAARLPNLLVTLAPESVSPAQIRALDRAGVIVSLGHSDCDYDTAMRCFQAGARMVTHLFNAMSPLTSRAPGLVGAALAAGVASAGVIADGVHVHPATLRTALAAKQGPGEIFLVTDAMAVAGSDLDRFTLNGRVIERRAGRLTLADGTLAGADLDLARAVQVMVDEVGDPVEKALTRATGLPAAQLRAPGQAGAWPATRDGLIYLSADFHASDLETAITASGG